MNVRPLLRTLLFFALASSVWLAGDLAGQSPAPSALTVIARETRRPIPLTTVGTQELVALDDLATAFQASLREDAGAITFSYKGRTIVLTPEQTLASVAGRVISLPSPPTRVGGRWFVPLDFISRALAPIYDQRLELRRATRLIILGDLRVPRMTLRHEPAGQGARLSIEMIPRASATVTHDQAGHLTVRLDADALDLTFPTGQIAGIIDGYRALDATAFAVELGPRFGAFRTSVQVADASSVLVIDITAQDATPAAPTTTQATPALPPSASPAELPSLLVTSSGLRTLVIDPGHGGDDRGAIGPKGTVEKDVTLALARRLKAAVEAQLGLRVLMTRDDDHLVAVSDRPAMANSNKADLFISLHANGSLQPSTSGATIYVAAPEAVAAAAGPSGERLAAYGGGFRDIELVPWNLAQARHRDQSELLASLLADAFRNRVPMTAAPIDRAPLRALESANMPALLVETGFLSNPEQEARLTSAEFQASVVQAIVDAIVRFRGGEPRP